MLLYQNITFSKSRSGFRRASKTHVPLWIDLALSKPADESVFLSDESVFLSDEINF